MVINDVVYNFSDGDTCCEYELSENKIFEHIVVKYPFYDNVRENYFAELRDGNYSYWLEILNTNSPKTIYKCRSMINDILKLYRE